MTGRKVVRDAALRALDAELEVLRRELAIVERARDTIARRAEDSAGRCDAATETSSCCGDIASAWCRACAWTVRRCTGHGGRHAASACLSHHERKHGAGWADTADKEPSP